MLNKFKRLGKEIVRQFAISFFFCCFIFVIVYLVSGKPVKKVISLINMISIEKSDSQSKPIEYDIAKKKLSHHPFYGEIWATLKIPQINLELSIYNGDDLNLLSTGVGHYTGSYFPSEGGSIILAAHNTSNFFRRLPELSEGSTIIIDADYGTFEYSVTSTKIINYQDTSSLPIQRDEEVLMLYTCYPVTALGLTPERYVVYAKLVGEDYEK